MNVYFFVLPGRLWGSGLSGNGFSTLSGKAHGRSAPNTGCGWACCVATPMEKTDRAATATTSHPILRIRGSLLNVRLSLWLSAAGFESLGPTPELNTHPSNGTGPTSGPVRTYYDKPR